MRTADIFTLQPCSSNIGYIMVIYGYIKKLLVEDKELKKEYLEKYMPKSDADPHGGAEDFKNIEDPNNTLPENNPGHRDEMR